MREEQAHASQSYYPGHNCACPTCDGKHTSLALDLAFRSRVADVRPEGHHRIQRKPACGFDERHLRKHIAEAVKWLRPLPANGVKDIVKSLFEQEEW